jgi:hypothetical protein
MGIRILVVEDEPTFASIWHRIARSEPAGGLN